MYMYDELIGGMQCQLRKVGDHFLGVPILLENVHIVLQTVNIQ